MQLVIGRLVDPRASRLRVGKSRFDLRVGQRCLGLECDLLERVLDMGELRLDASHWLAKEPQSLEQTHNAGTNAVAGRK